MNSLYKKDNLLSYVSEQPTADLPKPSIFKPKQNKNGLSTSAFICALSSIIFGIFLFPSILGITLGLGALLIAIKRGLPKKMPIISLVISSVTLIVSTFGLVWVVFASTPESTPYIPTAYTYDSHSGIAYRYNPISNIPCDSNGKCTFEVKLFQVDSQLCANGGTFSPAMQDMMTKTELPVEGFDFPALKNGEEHILNITLRSSANSRLIESSSYPINCK